MCYFRQPFSLAELTFFAIRRFNFKSLKYDQILNDMDLPFSLKPLPNFTKYQTIYDQEFKEYRPEKDKPKDKLHYFLKIFLGLA